MRLIWVSVVLVDFGWGWMGEKEMGWDGMGVMEGYEIGGDGTEWERVRWDIGEEIVGEEIVGEEIVGEEIVGEGIVGEEMVGEEMG